MTRMESKIAFGMIGILSVTLSGCGGQPGGTVAAKAGLSTVPAITPHEPIRMPPPPAGKPAPPAPAGKEPAAKEPTAKEPAAKALQFTRAEYDQIQLGMTDKQVKDALGKPTVEAAVEGATQLHYTRPDFSQAIMLKLKGGKVAHRIATNLGDKDPATLTKDNVLKVKEGMNAQEFVKRMGPATSEVDPDPDNNGEASLVWGKTPKPSLQVQLKDGKVTSFVHFGFDS
jgi:outer membrane protein assembly factor BamE (lipoprotein component of BamABCDE complex)